MLAHYVEFHMRSRLAPILFDDHDRAAAAAERTSIVAPAEISPAANRKAATRRTDDGLPVPSVRSLLDDLATLCLDKVTLPSYQKYCFDLPSKPAPFKPAPSNRWASGSQCSQSRTAIRQTLLSPFSSLLMSIMKSSTSGPRPWSGLFARALRSSAPAKADPLRP